LGIDPPSTLLPAQSSAILHGQHAHILTREVAGVCLGKEKEMRILMDHNLSNCKE